MKKTVFSLLSMVLVLLLLVSCGKTAVELAAPDETPAPTESPVPSELPEDLVRDLQKLNGLELPDAGTEGGGDRPLIAVTGTYIRKYDRNVMHLWEETYGDEIPFDFTFGPKGDAEFDAWSKSIKVGIMSGKGPDAFVLACGDSKLDTSRYPFPDLERAKRQGLFFPLDDLIAGSEYYHPEDHVQAVMDAGRLDGVQLVMPLTYLVPALMADEEWVTEEEIAAVETFDDLLYSENPYLAFQMQYSSYGYVFCDMMPDAVDYDAETVQLDAETLAAQLKEMHELAKATSDYENPEFPFSNDEIKRLSYEVGRGYLDAELWARQMGVKTFDTELAGYKFNPAPQMRLVPIPDENGDVTALITSFCAINANTKYPEECWKLLELLYSDEAQDGWIRYEDGIIDRAFDVAAPQGDLFDAMGGMPTGVRSHIYQAFPEELGKITRARFPGYLDNAYAPIFWDELSVGQEYTDEDYLKIAEDMIREIKLDLAE